MKRKDFLKGIGLAGVAAALPGGQIACANPGDKPRLLNSVTGDPVCTLIPGETAGPFPLDLTATYGYQLNVENSNVVFHSSKLMTAL